MPAAPAPFWMICRAPLQPNALTAPKRRFASEREARLTAQTLANQEDAPFVVLASTQILWPHRSDRGLFD